MPGFYNNDISITYKPLPDIYDSENQMHWLSTQSPQSTIQSVIERLKENHCFNHVTSINVAGRLSPWTLSPCCGFQKTTPTSHSPSTEAPVVNPGDVTFSPTLPRSEPQGELIELKVNPFNTLPFNCVVICEETPLGIL